MRSSTLVKIKRFPTTSTLPAIRKQSDSRVRSKRSSQSNCERLERAPIHQSGCLRTCERISNSSEYSDVSELLFEHALRDWCGNMQNDSSHVVCHLNQSASFRIFDSTPHFTFCGTSAFYSRQLCLCPFPAYSVFSPATSFPWTKWSQTCTTTLILLISVSFGTIWGVSRNTAPAAPSAPASNTAISYTE